MQVSAALTLVVARRLSALFVLAGRGSGELSSVGVQRMATPVLGQGAGSSCTKALCPSRALRVRLDSPAAAWRQHDK